MSTFVDLVRTILTDVPDLPGAACTGHRDIFDACTERGAHRAYAAAIKICGGCPQLAPCRRWMEGLPPRNRPVGCTAGIIRPCR